MLWDTLAGVLNWVGPGVCVVHLSGTGAQQGTGRYL